MNYSKKGVRERQALLNSKAPRWGHKLAILIVELILITVLGVGICAAAAGIGMFKGILASTPQITSNDVAPIGAATFVYDCEGHKIDELVATNSNRIMITGDKIPRAMYYAFVAIEDERFYQHNGIDIKGLARAGYQFFKTGGEETQGASTITQQLLKNTIFTEWTAEGDNTMKKIKRKFQEQYLAIQLTKTLEKDEILVRYMNTINLGQNTLGVEAAAQRYFGKPCIDLTLSECTVIAAITQNPSKYNPIRHPDENMKRRKSCLDTMKRLEFISEEEYAEALQDDVYSRIESHNLNYMATSGTSSYFVDALTQDVREDLLAAGYNETQVEFLLYSGGLRIHTTLDPKIQAIVDEEVANPDNYPANVKWYLEYVLTIKRANGEFENYSKEMLMKYYQQNKDKNFNLIFSSQEAAYECVDEYRNMLLQEGDEYEEEVNLTPQPQVSVVIMDQETGYVRAMAGGRGVKNGRLTLNRATDTVRQPGSTFKVLAAYAPAIDSAGINLSTVFNDAPFYYDTGTPVKNWYSGYQGLVTVRYAIEQSMNIIAVKTITQITPQLGYDYLQRFGFTTLVNGKVNNNGKVFTDIRQPLALGGVTDGVTNEELTAAYATIANGGVYNKPKLYTKILDTEGNVIIDNTVPKSHRVIQETTAFLLTDAMIGVVTAGTGGGVNFKTMTIAGKTGTTTSNVDVWFAGFTPYYTCATWAGYDNNVKMKSSGADQETGIAKKLWKNIMQRVHEGLPNQKFDPPSGIVRHQICASSGKLAIPGVCPEGNLRSEYFAEYNIPTETCDVHYYGRICMYEGIPASPECPFSYDGVCTLIPVEDSSLWQGSTIPIEQPNGSIIYQQPRTNVTCQHDAAFYSRPDYEAIISQQQWEMYNRNLPQQ